MRRFTDPLLFAVLFGLSALVWWIMDLRDAIPVASDGALAPMTVAVAVVIATPALLFVTVIAFFRALLNVGPRAFWAWVTGAAALAALLIWVANLITMTQSIEVGFSTGVWLMAIVSLAGLVAFVLALTGAIPAAGGDQQATPVDATLSKTTEHQGFGSEGDQSLEPASTYIEPEIEEAGGSDTATEIWGTPASDTLDESESERN